MNHVPYLILGQPNENGILIVADHASNHVPANIELGIDPSLLTEHIAWDIGVAAVAEEMVTRPGMAAFVGNISRLVVDLNRTADEQNVVPQSSDGVEIPGNRLSETALSERLGCYHNPYHDRLSALLAEHRPALILSLHSFTPFLKSQPGEKRPWEVGVLYNDYETASKLAIGFLGGRGLIVGDQLPYSGKHLNASMNRHAEGNNIPYIGIEMRQDLVSDASGQGTLAQALTDMCHFVLEKLCSTPQST